MDIKEVRIGNLINEQGLFLQVGMINSDVLKTAQPIPLTEEWLIKFGYRLESVSKWQSGYNDISRTDKIYTNNIHCFEDIETIEIDVISSYDETDLRRIGIRNTIGRQTCDIKYVHTFQNLIFALTGEELEYNG